MMNSKEAYPNVLVVNSQSMYVQNATGITLKSLWNSWPSNSFMEICFKAPNNKLSSKTLHIKRGRLVDLAQSNFGSKINTTMKCSITRPKVFAIENVRSSLRQFAALFIDSISGKMTRLQMYEIDRFQPAAIYTLGGGVSILKMAYKLSVKYNIPIILHFMDNWAEHIQWESNILLKPYQMILRKWLMKCVKRSPCSIAISDSMAEAYKVKFNERFEVLMNSVEPEYLYCKPSSKGDVIKFVYTGGLHLDRWKPLAEIAQSIKNSASPGILEIYTASNYAPYISVFENLPVQFFSSVPHSKMKRVFERADVLVHAETRSRSMLDFFKYSISTKIPEYLSSGRPIMFYGPRELGLYQYLLNNHAAYVASDSESLQDAISRIMQETDYTAVTDRALSLAKKNHDITKAHIILKQVILNSINYGV